MADLPPITPLDITADYSFQASKDVLQAKYTDTLAWAQWAGQTLNSNIVDIASTLGESTVEADIDALTAEIGTLLANAPQTITALTDDFADDLLTSLRSKLSTDITTASTGLGSAEDAMRTRESNAQATIRAAAYTEITTQFSSRGFDMPPGALLSKQTEMNNESSTKLSDASALVFAESARLAVDYNKHVLTVSQGLISILAGVFDSKQIRLFEAAKTTALLAVEDYKSTLGLMTARADIILKKGEMVLTAKARQMQLEVTTLAGLAQNASQMVASALNGVSVSSSFGWSAGASSSSTVSEDMNATRLADVHTTKAL